MPEHVYEFGPFGMLAVEELDLDGAGKLFGISFESIDDLRSELHVKFFWRKWARGLVRRNPSEKNPPRVEAKGIVWKV